MSVSEPEKQIASEVTIHQDASDSVHDKNEAALSPSSGSYISQQNVDSSINESALLRKLDRTLLPAVTLLYLLSFLDRSNGMSLVSYKYVRISHLIFLVGNARVEGLVEDLHMSTLPVTVDLSGLDRVNSVSQLEIST